MDNKYIEKLFFKQMKTLTAQTAAQSLDYQFSDGWLNV